MCVYEVRGWSTCGRGRRGRGGRAMLPREIPSCGLCAISVAERGLLAHKLRHLLLDEVEKQVNRYH
jgi:hypothetical protein